MEAMLERIGSVEFGDWLIQESEAEAERMDSANIVTYKAAKARLLALEQAMQLLNEFLILQEAMMASAQGAQGAKPATSLRRKDRRGCANE